jgi:hypothetical protein
MTYFQGECSHRRAEEEGEMRFNFNVGRVIVLNDLPALLWLMSEMRNSDME